MTKTSNWKYNKTKYYWFIDGHVYIPAVDWEGVRIEAIFDEDIAGYVCSKDASDCIMQQDRTLNIPEYLFAEIEQMVLQEVLMSGQMPSDGADDAQNALR